MSEQSLCNKCGAVLLPEAKFCGKCGAMVQSESPCASAAVVKTEEGAAEKEDDINTKKLASSGKLSTRIKTRRPRIAG